MTERKYELVLLALALFVFAAMLALNAFWFRPLQAQPIPSEIDGIGTNPGTTAVAASDTRVNINTATEQELMELPDIGQIRARAILQYRAENGLFRSVDELEKVNGIGSALLGKLREYVTLE